MREGALERKEALTSKMFKILSVANPGNGMGFLKEVVKHMENYEVPKMTLEKLQMVGTSKMTD